MKFRITISKYHSWYYLYLLINIPGEISHKNMISSRLKKPCYRYTWNDHCCYGYMINCTFWNRNDIEVKCFGISLVFIIINETLHGCLEIWNLFACWKIFQHWKRNFMSQHSHVISCICCLSLWYFTCILEMLCLLFQGCQNSDTLFFRYICVYLISAYSSLPLASQPRMLRQTFQRSCVIQWLPNWKAKSWGHLAVRQ